MNPLAIDGAVSLVTGSSRGIGRAIALELAKAGSDVCVTYFNAPEPAKAIGREIQQLGRRCIVVKADLSEEDDAAELCRIVGEELGGLDILVSNAAGGGFRTLGDATPAQFDYAMRINVRALMLLSQRCRPLFERRTLSRARIITLSSLGGTRALPMYGLIGAAKGAIESMTRHLAYELGDAGVNVNCICAGTVDTGALDHLPNKDAVLALQRERSLVGGANLSPEDVAGVALFLASPLADKIQGQTLVIDGGSSVLS